MPSETAAAAGVAARRVRHAHGVMVLYSFMISASFPVSQAITPYMDPVVLTLLRFSLAAILFGALTFAREHWIWPGPMQLLRYLLISACMVVFFLTMLGHGIPSLSVIAGLVVSLSATVLLQRT